MFHEEVMGKEEERAGDEALKTQVDMNKMVGTCDLSTEDGTL